MKIGITIEEEHHKLKDIKTCLKGSVGGERGVVMGQRTVDP